MHIEKVGESANIIGIHDITQSGVKQLALGCRLYMLGDSQLWNQFLIFMVQ